MAIRNVRPSWLEILKDDNGNEPTSFYKATGPRSRSGTLDAIFRARVAGQSVAFLNVEAIGSADGATVLWRITDLRNGTVLFEERVNQ